MPSSASSGAADPAALARRISGALLRLRRGSPFFAALALFARFVPTLAVPTACTDGRDVFYNPAFLAALPPDELSAVILHEVLHAALLHPIRAGARDPVRWNLAADIVVNGIVAAQPGMILPASALRDRKLEHLSVEEIYSILDAQKIALCPHCLRPFPGEGGGALAEIEAHWRRALRSAEAVARVTGGGDLPAGLDRLIREVTEPRLDWRTHLWRFLVRTPTDFGDFDRRFIHRRLYLEALTGESLRAFLAVDTSGSITGDVLQSFAAEVLGVVRAYPHLRAELYYADADVYGPYPLDAREPLPAPRGGGGTRFEPFFERIAGEADAESVIVYLTDGYGSFPARAPDAAVLWVVLPGGAADAAFPFGTVLRLVDDGQG
jgi:predicted metal-dependent peptidase